MIIIFVIIVTFYPHASVSSASAARLGLHFLLLDLLPSHRVWPSDFLRSVAEHEATLDPIRCRRESPPYLIVNGYIKEVSYRACIGKISTDPFG